MFWLLSWTNFYCWKHTVSKDVRSATFRASGHHRQRCQSNRGSSGKLKFLFHFFLCLHICRRSAYKFGWGVGQDTIWYKILNFLHTKLCAFGPAFLRWARKWHFPVRRFKNNMIPSGTTFHHWYWGDSCKPNYFLLEINKLYIINLHSKFTFFARNYKRNVSEIKKVIKVQAI